MNNMKTYIFIICTLIVTAGFACNKAVEPSAKSDTLDNLQQEYGEIGQQHNASLDHVMDGFQQMHRKGQRLSQSEIMNYAIDRNRRYVSSLFKSGALKQEARRASDREMTRMFSVDGDQGQFKGMNKSDTYAQRLKDPLIQDLEKKYLTQIGQILDTSEELEEIEGRILEVLEEAETELSEDKLKAVVIAGEVAVASSEYWVENAEEWRDQIEQLREEDESVQDLEDPTVQYMPWRSIAKADVQGGVTGAMGSLITGCGQMTVGACTGAGALGGAAVGSVGNAVGAVLDEFFVADPVDYPELNRRK